MQVTPQALEQPSGSAVPSAKQQVSTAHEAGTSAAASEVTPQQSPKHGLTATDPSHVTTPPQTIDRHASVDASSPVSVASADLESSDDIVTGQHIHLFAHVPCLADVQCLQLAAYSCNSMCVGHKSS